MAESTLEEDSLRHHCNRLEMPPLPQHRRLAGRKFPRHTEESSSRRPRRSPPRPHSRRNRRRERAVEGPTIAVQERPRTSAPGVGPNTSGREMCIDLTAEPHPPGPAVVDLTDTPVQLQRKEPIRRDSSDVEITGTEKKTTTPPARSFLRCPICLDMGSEFTAAGRDVVSTACGHIFCDLCLRQAIEDNRRCPTCRTSLRMKDFHKIYL